MPNINYIFNVSVEGGPSDTFSNKLITEAYDKISVTIPKAIPGTSQTKAVKLQPTDSEKVKFLCIKADKHHEDKDTKHLTYKADGEGKDVNLELDQVMIGSSLIKLLGDVKGLTFKSTFDTEVNIDILVGRETT